jgi:hypothetical protein
MGTVIIQVEEKFNVEIKFTSICENGVRKPGHDSP